MDTSRYVHVLATGFGERKRDAVETMITKLGAGNGSLCKSFLAKRTTSFRSGVEYGLGKGFLSAGLTNFRSLPNLFAPFLWATTYRLGTARGIPQAMFWARVTGEADTS